MQRLNLPNINAKLESLEKYLLSYDNYSQEQIIEIKHTYSHFKSELRRRWTIARKTEDKFIKQNCAWLEGTFTIPKVVNRPGRPTKTFQELCERSKRRRTEDLRSTTDTEVLTYAAQVKLGATGQRDASKIIKEITSSPKRAGKYKRAYSITLQEDKTQLTTLSALAMFVEAGLSRRQYEIIRNTNKKLYPCYSVLQKAKMECYPDKESYHVTENCAAVALQHLLDHTVTRLLIHLEGAAQHLSEQESNSLVLICKWGCDGSQQSQYKQTFQNDADSDANIFQSSFVPLQLICSTKTKNVIWQNPTPSSPRYCRPIRIRFIKESTDITNEEIKYVQEATNSLQDTKVTLADKCFSVKHTMMLTMVDGKVCNAATQTTSTMRCYICGATSKEFNNLAMKKEVNTETIKFGLSILHARIRIFESLLHLSYKLPVKKWQLRSDNEKDIVKQRKLQIQGDFRNKMGLIVDVPKPGFGNTNDGNTSRRFFIDPELSAAITGIDSNLIYRFKVILETISSGHKINVDIFLEYAMETAELYVKLYPWHPMTPTVHKILIHGPIVIENALLPVGQLSEEAAEARNKHFRLYRQNYARKFSRVSCNLDVLNRLLLSSDPLLTGMRPLPRKRTQPFLKETLQMLLPAEPSNVDPDSAEPKYVDSSNAAEESSDEEPWLSPPSSG